MHQPIPSAAAEITIFLLTASMRVYSVLVSATESSSEVMNPVVIPSLSITSIVDLSFNTLGTISSIKVSSSYL